MIPRAYILTEYMDKVLRGQYECQYEWPQSAFMEKMYINPPRLGQTHSAFDKFVPVGRAVNSILELQTKHKCDNKYVNHLFKKLCFI